MTTQQSTLQRRAATIDKSKLSPEQVKGLELIETRRKIHELKIMIVSRADKNLEVTVKLIQKWLQSDPRYAEAMK